MFMTRTIAANLLQKYSTRLHPFEKRPALANSRSKLVFFSDTCILCKLCSRKCPSQVITVEPETGLWECDLMGCVNCGVCADVCPTDSIIMAEEYREPFTQRTALKYYCKPRPKKSKGAKAAAGDQAEGDDQAEAGDKAEADDQAEAQSKAQADGQAGGDVSTRPLNEAAAPSPSNSANAKQMKKGNHKQKGKKHDR